MAVNSNRRTRQKELDIRVILGNPPYSAGQDSANDNAANLDYPRLDNRIRETYAARSRATLKNSLYDSYIRAIRWASDRIGNTGVVGFVTNGGWIDANTADGLRKCLVEEFSSLYIFHLRGNQRTSGERSRKEGGKIFGQGSRTPVAIAILVKNPASAEQGVISFHDIGDYLSREQKLDIVARFGSLNGLANAKGWTRITPDEHGDWLRQRDGSFTAFVPIGSKDEQLGSSLFEGYSRGLQTGRDAWCYNPSRSTIAANMERMVACYQDNLRRFWNAHGLIERRKREDLVQGFIDTDATRISWTRSLKADLAKGKSKAFDNSRIRKSFYRPFSIQHLYLEKGMIEMPLRIPAFFPEGADENRAIMVKGNWSGDGHFVLMTSLPPSDQPDGGVQ